MTDLRQSDNWAMYLSNLGWKVEEIEGNKIYHRQTGLGEAFKIQRPNDLSDNFLAAIDALAISKKALYVKVEPLRDKHVELLTKHGFSKNPFPLLSPSTIQIDLSQSEETLWKRLPQDTRYSIRRALKLGVSTQLITSESDPQIEAALKTLEVCGKSRGFFVPSRKELGAMLKSFEDSFLVCISYLNNKPVSTSIILFTDDSAFYMFDGTTKEGRKFFSGYKQMWEVVRFLKNKGIKTFDLEGVYDERFPSFTGKWLGFSYFKRKFGGQEIRFPTPYIKIYNKIVQKLQNLSRTPLPL